MELIGYKATSGTVCRCLSAQLNHSVFSNGAMLSEGLYLCQGSLGLFQLPRLEVEYGCILVQRPQPSHCDLPPMISVFHISRSTCVYFGEEETRGQGVWELLSRRDITAVTIVYVPILVQTVPLLSGAA